MSNLVLVLTLIVIISPILFVWFTFVNPTAFERWRKTGTLEWLKNFNHIDLRLVGCDENIIRGLMIFSPNSKSGRTIVMVPAWGHIALSLEKQAILFLSLGYHVVIFDHRSHGDSGKALPSLGIKEAKDLVLVIKHIRKMALVDSTQIYLYAESMGAVVTLIALKTLRNRIKGIILEGLVLTNYNVISGGVPNFLPRVVLWYPYWSAYIAVHFLAQVDISVKSTNYLDVTNEIPTLIIRGEHDRYCLPVAWEEIKRHLGEKCEIWCNEGGGHLDAYEVSPDEYKRQVSNFMSRF